MDEKESSRTLREILGEGGSFLKGIFFTDRNRHYASLISSNSESTKIRKFFNANRIEMVAFLSREF